MKKELMNVILRGTLLSWFKFNIMKAILLFGRGDIRLQSRNRGNNLLLRLMARRRGPQFSSIRLYSTTSAPFKYKRSCAPEKKHEKAQKSSDF